MVNPIEFLIGLAVFAAFYIAAAWLSNYFNYIGRRINVRPKK